MENRKLLLVAISAGIFLVIAVGSAIVFTPQQAEQAPIAAVMHPAPSGMAVNVTPAQPVIPAIPPGAAHPAAVDPIDMVRGPVDVLGLQPPPEGAFAPPGDFVVTGVQQPAPPVVITVPRPTVMPSAPAPVRPAPVAPAPAPVRPAPAVAAPVPAPPAPAVIRNDYWVQTGSFSTIANAERARDDLAFMGITAVIENREVAGRTWFRVRVGPYTSHTEANYWLALIRAMDGFDSDIERYRPTVWQTARR